MTSDNDDKLNRRNFIISATTVALAGCSSFTDDSNDLPPPNYEENPGSEEEEEEEDTDNEPPQEQTDSVELSEDEKQFLSIYRSAYTNVENGIDLLTQALDQFNNREFDQLNSTIVDSQLALTNARSDILRREFTQSDGSTETSQPEIWKISKNMDDKTDLDLQNILENFENAITTGMEGTRLARTANSDRANGDIEEYNTKRNKARIKVDQASFYLPMPPSELRRSYISDLLESSE